MSKSINSPKQHGAARAKYGIRLIKSIAERLSVEFGANCSERRLRDYRQFYLSFNDLQMRVVISALRLIRKSSCTTVHSGFLICASLEIPPFGSASSHMDPFSPHYDSACLTSASLPQSRHCASSRKNTPSETSFTHSRAHPDSASVTITHCKSIRNIALSQKSLWISAGS